MSGFGGNRIKSFLVVMKKRAQIFVSFLLKMFSVQDNKMESSPCSYFPFSFFNSREETHQTKRKPKKIEYLFDFFGTSKFLDVWSNN